MGKGGVLDGGGWGVRGLRKDVVLDGEEGVLGKIISFV